MGNRPFAMFKSGRKTSVSASTTTASCTSPISGLEAKEQRLETFLLVWLDPDVDTSEENQATQKRLRQILTCLITFSDSEACEQWINKCCADEKIILIVSGRLGKKVVPNIHHLTSIITIYVYCWDVKRNEKWARNYPKVCSVVSKTMELEQQLANLQTKLEDVEDSKAIKIFKDYHRTRELDPTNAALIWYQLLLEILISPSYLPSRGTPAELIEILRHYSSEDKDGLTLIKQFERTYEARRAVSWLMRDTPLTRFINRALREQDINMLFQLRFILSDIHTQLTNHPTDALHVYKLQPMLRAQLDNIKAHKNQHLVLNGFLFTSTEKPDFGSTTICDDQCQIVLLEIDARAHAGTSPFAYVHEIDATIEEQLDREVLFMCGSVFQIGSLTQDQNSNWTLRLTLTGEKDFELLADMKRELRENRNLCMIGDLLGQCDQHEKAIVYFKHLLQELPPNHALVSHIKAQINNAKVSSVMLSNVQFVLVDLSTRLSQLASAMLNALCSLIDGSVMVFEDVSNVDFNQLPNKPTLLFASSQFVSSMKKKPKQITAIFTLENDQNKIDQRERFATGEDLICQLADEIYRYYKQEGSEHFEKGDPAMAKKKYEQANRIHSELRKVHKISIVNEDANQSPVSTTTIVTTLVWLTSKVQDENDVQQIKKQFSPFVSSVFATNNENECHHRLLADEYDHTVFLIIDSDYNDKIVANFQELTNVKYMYRYGQSSSKEEPVITNYDDLNFRLANDLIAHYGKLGAECRSRKDLKQARDMFLKAQKLCLLLANP